jgi:hypothetical protein
VKQQRGDSRRDRGKHRNTGADFGSWRGSAGEHRCGVVRHCACEGRGYRRSLLHFAFRVVLVAHC